GRASAARAGADETRRPPRPDERPPPRRHPGIHPRSAAMTRSAATRAQRGERCPPLRIDSPRPFMLLKPHLSVRPLRLLILPRRDAPAFPPAGAIPFPVRGCPMSLCPLTRILAPLALAAVVIAGVARGETPAQSRKPVLKVYSVADLIVPIPGMAPAAPVAAEGRASHCESKPCCADD